MKRATAVLSVSVLALAACGGDDDPISIENEWARQSPAGATSGAVYFDVTADEADTLVGASVDESVAASAEIHEVVAADSGDMGDMDAEMESEDMGMMQMQEMEGGLPLPAGETVNLAPGGYHVMLIDLPEPLEIGDEFDVTLQFANADDVTVTVEVAKTAP